MPNWTKGPWEMYTRRATYRAGKKEEAKLKAYGMPTQFEAVSIGTKQGQVAIIPLDESSLANGQLITAAPDMCELLDAMVKYHKSGGTVGDNLIFLAEQALAKANREVE